MEIFVNVVFSFLVACGLVMVFVPFVPALLYMLIVTTIFAAVGGFGVITVNNLIVLSAIVLISFLVDTLAGVIGARWGGASKKSIGFGILGLVTGLILLPPIGAIIGLFVGVFLSEIRSKNGEGALKAASGSLIGALAGMIINFFLALTFFILFIVFLAN
ncbi:MAG: hypothetical protein A3H57_00235 [Candidatus Taylorbacteria bacterium RIFCSPLOWO2_02_FULL_43_11]|uniref:DUF456 domain-containing protein n=1 Tax=Candidatus Taylorbacteria bacterium RIFCSPHIGHO2_02_FULL_43_32b TaxID=1802306 RepID=A0A1G2MH58_9BACT|nr:MAG: hypothetical protein A2743_00670 [Candidatus Taylorbacteria bacterium RIFCSPHIGHO2_01_FULL_43_47]OHA22509.1 MAG: hypothetical protein A3C72_00235 [Candidatus Taylorbacteria bacterium RIFCSPHIGHO2_02_FULL_43_32b]OHA29416.1 MAG: hypothetical protein A3B08_03885 [Candidatus Taylorbacteria bacterium RIFCSPLOWO2_01_FULL_43_44]OHA35902.1 MAG: hypothetical protein A3H57_00235 [Candidatus Taylorbacteria bacterium RIFCSPLOWO2_02_FULL_43_11]